MLAAIRTLLVLVSTAAYIFIAHGVLSIFLIAPPVHRLLSKIVTSLISRLILFVIGYFWIPVEVISRKRSRGNTSQAWSPRAGDVIVSNWASVVEILWLAFRFNPIFVLPVPETPVSHAPNTQLTPIAHTPGRRTGTGSANIASTTRTASAQIPIIGFQTVSLLTMVRQTGLVPPFPSLTGHQPCSLEDIRRTAPRPLVVFPECTSSNGRGLLRFADVFKRSTPVAEFTVFIMCVRYDPPTTFSPTPTLSVPSPSFNPLPHLFSLTTSITVPQISIRLLSPAESPSSPLFVASEVIGDMSSKQDLLTEACAVLIAQTGKLKRMSMGWEDKARFLDFYRGKRTCEEYARKTK
ncbi:hypothetical protein E1B28_004454 [Marasmius oreades]|nr:uncharacterized protein E1B28_004454 [Marasmius oreades]KAG7097067.1 hypothetical protein E1B28_004454 [Marasmius oreades]